MGGLDTRIRVLDLAGFEKAESSNSIRSSSVRTDSCSSVRGDVSARKMLFTHVLRYIRNAESIDSFDPTRRAIFVVGLDALQSGSAHFSSFTALPLIAVRKVRPLAHRASEHSQASPC